MKYLIDRLVASARSLARILGAGVFGSIALVGLVAFRHMLATPQPLDSPLPGEAHLYRWTHGHIYYKVAGAQDAPPLVLLHTPELDGSAYEMLGIMEPLAAHYRVYALDLLGFGLSDRPDITYTAELYTQLLHDFLANVVAKPATLVASRLSCNFVIAVAASSPQYCSRLVLLSPTALYGYQAGTFGLPHPISGILATRIIRVKQAQMLLYPLLVAIARLFRRIRYGQPERTIVRSFAAGQSNPTPDYKYATTHQFGAEHAPMDWLVGNLSSDVSDEIETLRQPTLIIWGTGALEHVQQGRDTSIAAGLDDSEAGGATTRMVLLQRTRSAVQEELPETVAQTILQWSVEPALAEVRTTIATDPGTPNQPAGVPEPVNDTQGDTTQQRIEAYCMKCKEKRAILNPREVTMKNGRLAVQGDCEVCGSSLFRMGRLAPGYPQTPI